MLSGVAPLFVGSFGGLEGRVHNRRVALEHALDGLAQVLQQVPAIRDLLSLGGACRRRLAVGCRVVLEAVIPNSFGRLRG
jgi:hypothetical protein